MSPLYSYNGKLLVKNGALAAGTDCCCGGCCCVGNFIDPNATKETCGGTWVPHNGACEEAVCLSCCCSGDGISNIAFIGECVGRVLDIPASNCQAGVPCGCCCFEDFSDVTLDQIRCAAAGGSWTPGSCFDCFPIAPQSE